MKEIISQITPTSIHHPAIGVLYNVLFESGNKKLLYEETFFHQFEDYGNSFMSFKDLIGKEIDFSEVYFDEQL